MIAEGIENIRRILKTSNTIAVVGLSANWWRPSFFAAKYMQDHGYKIIPVNPNYETILGEKCYPSLEAIPHDTKIDIVDVFQRIENVPPIAEAAINIKAKTLWLQLGLASNDVKKRVESAGLEVIMDRCIKIEHGRLLGGLNLFGVSTKVISAKRPKWLVY